MNEERIHILKMLQEGKITVDEAAKLIEAVGIKPDAEVQALVRASNETQPTPFVQPAPATSTALQPRFQWSLLTFLFSNLQGATVDGGFYEGARIFCSNLEQANLHAGDFREAWVLCANLEGANFAGAKLAGARIFGSNLDHADFRDADLRDAVILCTNLDHADFRGADLRGKTFIGMNLAGHRAEKTLIQATEA